ncbi:hypothetical protein HMPREF3040_02235 [Escherichia coli]|nr:hypothetical protein HMPREF1606_00592 [Escherichia coli 908522]KXG99186.1 hypothetical protein HMPREF3040_02235 [Escherichia coli]
MVLQAHQGWCLSCPIKLGRSSRWLKSEVETWLQARIAQSRP